MADTTTLFIERPKTGELKQKLRKLSTVAKNKDPSGVLLVLDALLAFYATKGEFEGWVPVPQETGMSQVVVGLWLTSNELSSRYEERDGQPGYIVSWK